MLHFHKIYQLVFVQMSYNAIMKTKVISKECIITFDKYLRTKYYLGNKSDQHTFFSAARYAQLNGVTL